MKKMYMLLLSGLPLIASTQNVGIGIFTPTERLEVKQSVRSTVKISSNNFSDTTQLRFSNRNNFDQGTDFLFTHAREDGFFVTTASDLASLTNDSLLTMLLTGNIGVGVKQPQHRFHVHSTAATTNINITNLGTTAASGNGLLLGINGLNGYLFNVESGNLQLGTSNLTRMIILSNGNIGLGTSTPDERLDINGNLTVTGEVYRPSTGPANLIPIAWGLVSPTGFIQTGSENFTVSHTSSGFYQITITGEAYQFQQYSTIATPIGTISPYVACTGSGGGMLQVQIYDLTGAEVDQYFSFVVYKK